MNTATSLSHPVAPGNNAASPSQPAERTAQRIIGAVRKQIIRLSLDERERYLAAAGDHDDLEKRMRAWDENEQRRLWMILP